MSFAAWSMVWVAVVKFGEVGNGDGYVIFVYVTGTCWTLVMRSLMAQTWLYSLWFSGINISEQVLFSSIRVQVSRPVQTLGQYFLARSQ